MLESISLGTPSKVLREQHLVETDWLAEHLSDVSQKLRIIDMRGFVKTETSPNGLQTAEYLGAVEEYEKSHIPGAIYLDWTRDIVDLENPVPVQLASPEKIKLVLESAGIGEEHQIIVYDAHPASQFATRLWWALRYYGHFNIRVLNGGWAKWLREGRPRTTEKPHFPPSSFTPKIQSEGLISAKEIFEKLGNPNINLIDARDEGQFTGKIQRGERGGHIPGALSLPREVFFTQEGVFRNAEELVEIIDKNCISHEKQTIAYCNGGVAATSVLFTLSMLGYSQLYNYDGSWNEWNLRKELPIE